MKEAEDMHKLIRKMVSFFLFFTTCTLSMLVYFIYRAHYNEYGYLAYLNKIYNDDEAKIKGDKLIDGKVKSEQDKRGDYDKIEY